MFADLALIHKLKKGLIQGLTRNSGLHLPKLYDAPGVGLLLERGRHHLHREDIDALYDNIGFTTRISLDYTLQFHERSDFTNVGVMIEIDPEAEIVGFRFFQQLLVTRFINV